MENKAARKALIREYKESPRPMGVYRVRNTVDERSLVGASIAALSLRRGGLQQAGLRWCAVPVGRA